MTTSSGIASIEAESNTDSCTGPVNMGARVPDSTIGWKRLMASGCRQAATLSSAENPDACLGETN